MLAGGSGGKAVAGTGERFREPGAGRGGGNWRKPAKGGGAPASKELAEAERERDPPKKRGIAQGNARPARGGFAWPASRARSAANRLAMPPMGGWRGTWRCGRSSGPLPQGAQKKGRPVVPAAVASIVRMPTGGGRAGSARGFPRVAKGIAGIRRRRKVAGGSLKTEPVCHRRFAARGETKREITGRIEIFYDRMREQARLGYLSPAAPMRRHHEKKIAA